MNPFINSWQYKNLISLIKKSPIASLPHSKKSTTIDYAMEAVWKDIASKLYMSPRKCKLQWTKIKMKYVKIMKLIKTGDITMEAAMLHPEASRYLDGLNFLDPYIRNIKDKDIPLVIHRSINTMFSIKPKGSSVETPGTNNPQFVTHRQVKELLLERKRTGENVKNMDRGHLLTVLDMAVERKLGELLLMKNASSNQRNDIANNNGDENTVNLTMMPSKNVQIVHNLNNNEENGTRTNNLGLQSELILDDDIKIEEEDDLETEEQVDISTDEEVLVNSPEDNLVKDEHSTYNQNEDDADMEKEYFVFSKNVYEDFVKNENDTTLKKNTTEMNYDLEISLPRARILTIGQHTKDKDVKGLPEDAIIIENITEDMTDTTPVTDEYIRKFFSELGVVMSMELSLDKQKELQSRINELLRNVILLNCRQ